MLKVETEVLVENKNQTTNTDDAVSSQKPISKVCSDSRPRLQSKLNDSRPRLQSKPSGSQPRLPSKSGVRTSKCASHSSSQFGLKQPTDSAVISSAALQELKTDVAAKSVSGKSVTSGKKTTVRYKPAHHSAPFKTMPLPPGQSRLPPVSRPGSRKTLASSVRASQVMQARSIDRHGGNVNGDSLAASQAVERRKLVHDEGQVCVTGRVSVEENGLPFSFDRNSSNNIASGVDVSHSRSSGLHQMSTDADGTADLMCHSGIPNCGGIPGDNVTRLGEGDASQTAKPQRPNDGTYVAASTVIGRQSELSSAAGMTTNDVSRRTKAVDQSPTALQQDASQLDSQQNVAANSSSSFILQRDGQVTYIL